LLDQVEFQILIVLFQNVFPGNLIQGVSYSKTDILLWIPAIIFFVY